MNQSHVAYASGLPSTSHPTILAVDAV
ncbi:hypothetical protein A2U01_0089358, partial [Trifolium medium]|nr:hypothetical protein [Trifolium medium]